MEKEASILIQLSKSLEEAEIKLETAYKEKDYDGFNKSKKLILEIQKNITERIK